MIKYIISIGDTMHLGTVLFRTVFFYIFILVIYRLMGKREIGQLSIQDLVVSILIAEMVAISIENKHDSMWLTILPIIVLVILEIVANFISLKFNFIRNIIEGKPALIINKGIINFKEMIKQRYSLDDLLVSLRQASIKSIEDVEYAFLEPNGELSIFKYNFFKTKSAYPQALILDGELQTKVVKHIRKTPEWVIEQLQNKDLTIKDIFYAFYKNKKLYIIKKGS
mgnify:CR=1 FL=1